MRARKKQGQPRTRRVFSGEIKLEAVQHAAGRRAAGVPLTQIARELRITDELLRRWKWQAGAPRTDAFPGQGCLSSDESELRRLEREVRGLSLGECVSKYSGGVIREGVTMSDKYAAITDRGTLP